MWATALAVGLGGCYGGIQDGGGSDPGADGGETDGADGGGGPGDPDADGNAVPLDCELGAKAKLRMLTRAELDGSLQRVFGIAEPIAIATLPADPRVNGYVGSAEAALMTDVRLEQVLAVSLSVGETVRTDLAAYVPCAAADPSPACARSYIEATLPRLYRRPVTNAEIEQILGVFTTDFDGVGGFEEGIAAATAAMVMSPAHLYRSELGENGYLTTYEIADLLAFTLTGAPPDDALSALAEGETLFDEDVRVEQARRLLATERGRAHLVEFVWQWLELDELAGISKADPAFTPEVLAQLQASLRRYIEHALFEDDGTVETLLSARYTFANATLADVYGFAADSETLTRVDTDDRPGLLAQPGLLAAFAHPDGSSPVKRGAMVRERLLCQTLPPPPPTVDTNLPNDPGLDTTRARTEAHVSDPTCAGCHQLIDPLGYAFENYDGLGRWRDLENGVTVDASGEVSGTDRTDGTFTNLAGMVDLLAPSDDVQDCFAMNFHMVAMGAPTPYDDACVPEDFLASTAQAEGNVAGAVARWIAQPAAIVRKD